MNNNITDREKLAKLKKFAKQMERNVNTYVPPSWVDKNTPPKGYFLKVHSVNGVQLSPVASGNKRCIRLFFSFFNSKTKEMFGNTYRTPMIEPKLLDKNYFDLKSPVFSYFLGNIDVNSKLVLNCEIISCGNILIRIRS